MFYFSGVFQSSFPFLFFIFFALHMIYDIWSQNDWPDK